ncbi:ROK family transcriptional regulator [Kocuria marina]|uniref:ROK family transcriptional regulator n=1 Tax=Kocuria marina TaxID=223184 RepID=UPI000BF02851
MASTPPPPRSTRESRAQVGPPSTHPPSPQPASAQLPAPGSQTALRLANRRRVVDAVRELGAATQASIARETALAPSTVSSIVHELTACDLLAMEPEHGGRRGQRVHFSESAGYLVGVDVGHRHASVAVADLNLDVRAQRRIDLPAGHRAEDVLTGAREILDELRTSLDVPAQRILGAGLTLPAPVDAECRGLGSEAILPAWAGLDLRALATGTLGCPTVVENDANAGAVAEHALGAGRGTAHMAYLKLSHGVGAGLILGGGLYRGATGSAGEIGHVTLDERAGLCRCGNRGCLETFVSSQTVLDVVASSGRRVESVGDVVREALAGDPGCTRVITDTGRLIGGAVAQLCNAFNPELVVVGGELARAEDLLLDPVRDAVQRYAVRGCVSGLRIVTAQLGARAHLIGALIRARAETSLPV